MYQMRRLQIIMRIVFVQKNDVFLYSLRSFFYADISARTAIPIALCFVFTYVHTHYTSFNCLHTAAEVPFV